MPHLRDEPDDLAALIERSAGRLGLPEAWVEKDFWVTEVFDARVSTEYAIELPESACVYCGNCIGVCPTGALMFKSEFDMREAGTWDESKQSITQTVCAYCGVGCNLELHVQDNSIVKVTSPLDHDITNGHLCIKGRFGWEYVQSRGEMPEGP